MLFVKCTSSPATLCPMRRNCQASMQREPGGLPFVRGEDLGCGASGAQLLKDEGQHRTASQLAHPVIHPGCLKCGAAAVIQPYRFGGGGGGADLSGDPAQALDEGGIAMQQLAGEAILAIPGPEKPVGGVLKAAGQVLVAEIDPICIHLACGLGRPMLAGSG